MLLLLLSPLLFWFQLRKSTYFRHCLMVFAGRCSWVGYTGHEGFFSPADLFDNPSAEVSERLMVRYMRHYRISYDIAILLNNWRKI